MGKKERKKVEKIWGRAEAKKGGNQMKMEGEWEEIGVLKIMGKREEKWNGEDEKQARVRREKKEVMWEKGKKGRDGEIKQD